ncbi:hypothetical protein ACFQY4_13910 [Catellatospora bangladeshensis]|uniref:hypothetical protein n=1 Tax=Catellatospora bangladeshensis TaxID=310355 RepID=UPI0036118524
MTTVGGAVSVKDQLVRILRRLLHGSPHSYERTSYLTSLLALDTERTTQLLPLGLLDCEPGVRLLAAEHTPPTDDARQWLADLSRDPLEEDDVREAAGRRLHPLRRLRCHHLDHESRPGRWAGHTSADPERWPLVRKVVSPWQDHSGLIRDQETADVLSHVIDVRDRGSRP